MRPVSVCALAAVGLATAACDIPTDPPIVEQRWVLPLEEVTLEQEELLPADVTISGNAYDVSIPSASAGESLGNLCSACGPLDGLTTPTPPYQGSFTSTANLPTDMVSVDIQSGSVDVVITNNLSFDPLAGGGTITITASEASGGPVLSTLVLDGAVDALPAPSVTSWTLPLAAVTLGGPIETTIEVDHVGGVLTTIDVTQDISVTAVTTSLLVSSATVAVDGISADLTDTTIDAALDDTVLDGIQSGTVSLDVTNPFGVSFDGTITVGTVTKNVSVTADPMSTVDITYTATELQSFLGMPDVLVRGQGTVSGGPAVLTPALELTIDTTIDLIIQLGN